MGANTQCRTAWMKPIGSKTQSAPALASSNANDINAENWGMSILSRI